MNKAFVITAALLLSSLPAFSQGVAAGDDRDSSYAKRDRDKDRDLGEMLRGLGEGGREGPRRGAAFFLRNGDATVGVRCDPQDSMRACVDATLTLIERARSMTPSGTSSGTAPGTPPPPR